LRRFTNDEASRLSRLTWMRGLLWLCAITACVASVGCVNIVGSVGRAAAAPKSAQGAAAPDRWSTVWLCRPGLANNPCTHTSTTTVVGPTGASKVQRQALAARPAIDCFYVYPSVSPQSTTNANLQIDPQERDVAIAQASRFSQVCRVYAPMYPQLTLRAVLTPGGITVVGALTAYEGLLAAFRNYLAHYNHGRGIVFIGHSQGASMLIGLLQQEVDPNPAVRRLLVSALIMGGNVTVPADAPSAVTSSTSPSAARSARPGVWSPTRASTRRRRLTATSAASEPG
jgi:hypothetical protein